MSSPLDTAIALDGRVMAARRAYRHRLAAIVPQEEADRIMSMFDDAAAEMLEAQASALLLLFVQETKAQTVAMINAIHDAIPAPED